MKQRIALQIEYSGHLFHGWQKQPNGLPTIQEHLETAIEKIAGHPVHTVASGRTDRGVHALGQIVHFDTHVQRPERSWLTGVNTFLPDAITVQAASCVASDFHARFSALKRSYRYVLYNHKIRPALLHQKVGWSFLQDLNIEKMFQAASHLLGEHDFSSFRSSECQAKSPIRHLYHVDIYRQGHFIFFDFTANGFLHHMVRNLVGSLLYVGCGKYTPQQFIELMHACNRRLAPPTFMPDGLYLTHISYPQHQLNFQAALPTWFWGKNDSTENTH